jgi:hypothetical protein
MNLKTPELSDLPFLKGFFEENDFTNSGYTAAMLYLWAPSYDLKYTVMYDMLVCVHDAEPFSFAYPIGKGDPKPVIDALMAYCKEEGIPFCMYGVTKELERRLVQMYGDCFNFEYDRDEADYVYLSEKLISLSGKKYHGKRNHINRFNESHTWDYEPINDENVSECMDMLLAWQESNDVAENESMAEEAKAAQNALRYRDELGLSGGLIRCEGEIIAFSLGEPLTKDMFVVHFEKAFSSIQGAYPIINQQFVLHEASEYKYINREEDCGEEGLRKAKLSYHPEMMVEKAVVTLKKS